MNKINKLGVVMKLSNSIMEEFRKIKGWGFETCHLTCFDRNMLTDGYAELVNLAVEKSGIEITAFWCGLDNPAFWNFYDGPSTLGLVPSVYRHKRIETLLLGSDFARKTGIKNVATQMGFIPEDPYDSNYMGVVNTIRFVAGYCKNSNQSILFETGLDTPVTLKRIIQDIGFDNVGVNFDPANLLMWGKANPIDALDILSEYIFEVHAKDGEYPTDVKNAGVEKPLGQGRVNVQAFVSRLDAFGYKGPITIETYAAGGLWDEAVLAAKKLLESIMHK
ncbi:MAG: sugar phosphate isomerase/epimerase [Ruminiclostridium sp.]|nr:sugar phosphate isomerase/epimerase [Ruminiclostridium sp.]